VAHELKSHLRVRFGAEHHMKSRVDACFARVSGAIEWASRLRDVVDAHDAVKACREWVAQHKSSSGVHHPHDFIDYLPPPKKELRIFLFHSRCLPLSIRACHEWSFRRADIRRLSLFGRVQKNVLTGIEGRCHPVPHQGSKDVWAYFPEAQFESGSLLKAVAPVEPLDSDEEDCERPALSHTVQDYEGWRFSYRKTTPEAFGWEQFQKRLRWKATKMAEAQVVAAPRRRVKGSSASH
jgi:hypothetical protein